MVIIALVTVTSAFHHTNSNFHTFLNKRQYDVKRFSSLSLSSRIKLKYLSEYHHHSSLSVQHESVENIDHDDDIGYHDCHIFLGKNKWLGGALDPQDGTIYGIPSNTDEIICLLPPRLTNNYNNSNAQQQYQIHTIPLPKSITKGKFKWLRGIICNDCLYGIPAWNNDGVLKLDLKKFWEHYNQKNFDGRVTYDDNDCEDLVSIIPLPDEFHNLQEDKKPSRWLWHGAAVNSNRTAIYCIPSNAFSALKVDLLESKCSLLDIPETMTTPLKQTNKWYGGILGEMRLYKFYVICAFILLYE